MKSNIITATIALAFLFGCSEKCGDKKCGGDEYNPVKQFCEDGQVMEK